MASSVTRVPSSAGVEQFGNSGDLVGFVIHPALPQHKPLFTGPGADPVQRGLLASPVEGAADRLAIDRHDLVLAQRGDPLRPRGEAGLEGVGINQYEHPPKGVMRGDTIGQGEKPAQPVLLAAPIEHDIFPTLRTGDDGTDRNHQNVDQPMLDLARTAGIVEFG
jgi:hypothetical protein